MVGFPGKFDSHQGAGFDLRQCCGRSLNPRSVKQEAMYFSQDKIGCDQLPSCCEDCPK
jgi:hypothetical protein